jgi:hypothetical protein
MLAPGRHRLVPLTPAGRLSSFRAGSSKIQDRDPGHGSVPATEAHTGTHLPPNRQHAERVGDAWVGLSGHPDPRSVTPTLEIHGSGPAHGMLYVRLQARWNAEFASVRSTPLLEARAAVLPATRPCSGCRLPPVVRLRPHRRPPSSFGRASRRVTRGLSQGQQS